MITMAEYVGPHAGSADWNLYRRECAERMLVTVNALMDLAEQDGVELRTNPHTGSRVSGKTFGGFRPQSCPQGAPDSSHKQGMGVDVYDPGNYFDNWLMENRDVLEALDLYMEHPDATPGWVHLTTRAPRSQNRVFMP